jgi:hypothetical protein
MDTSQQKLIEELAWPVLEEHYGHREFFGP